MYKYFAKTHECIAVDNNKAKLTITDHALQELGDVVYVELPKLDQEVKKGDAIIVVESVKAASDVYAPVSGKVVELNTKAIEDPSIINDRESGDSWFIIIDMSDPSECDSLLSEEEYKKTLD